MSLEIRVGDRVKIEPVDEPGGPTIEATVDRIVNNYVGVTRDDYIPDPRASATEMVVLRSQIVEVLENPIEQADISETPVPNVHDIRNY